MVSFVETSAVRGIRTEYAFPSAGDYERSVETSNSAANITNVLYPNDSKFLIPTG
jgi:hypothetical protein